MSESNGVLPMHCGDCRHWHKMQADPRSLGSPPQGQCRLNPPTPQHVVAQDQTGRPMIISTLVSFPVIQNNHPACSHHAARLAIVEAHE